MFILLLSVTEEILFLSAASKLIMTFLFLMAIWVLWKCVYWAFESKDIIKPTSEDNLNTDITDLQTYQRKEIEALKKKYDNMDADKRPVLYFDPSSDNVYLCRNGEKTPLGDTGYLS